jgi:hypothetical protein
MKMIWFEKVRDGYSHEPCYAVGSQNHKPHERLSTKCAVTMGKIEHPDRVVKVLEQLGFRNVEVTTWDAAYYKLRKLPFEDAWNTGKTTKTVIFDCVNQPHSLLCLASLIARHCADNRIPDRSQDEYDISTPFKFWYWADRYDCHMGSLTRNNRDDVADSWEEVGNLHRAAPRGSWLFKKFLMKDYQ